ncbi:MAG TPA: response regulator [Candidatus Omnitrophota bacterium]|nr:response regulator [Candidatus Omnitrophota bacterium]
MTEPKRILIVDDEVGFTEMVKLNLEDTGRFLVRIENDSTRAFETALGYRPELILLDIIMPEMEGPDVLCQLRENEQTAQIPIIFLTATVRKSEVNQEDGFISGYPFLAKPCTVEELIQAIDQNI